MPGKSGRLRQVMRLERMRAVGHRQALAALAVARVEHRRLEDLSARSRSMAEDYGGRSTGNSAAVLATNHHFSRQMQTLQKAAGTLEEQAGASANGAMDRLVHAEQMLDHAAERRKHAMARLAAKNMHQQGMAEVCLARRLQRKTGNAAEPAPRRVR